MRVIAVPFGAGGRGPGPAAAPTRIFADLRAHGWDLEVTEAFPPIGTAPQVLTHAEIADFMRRAAVSVAAHRDEQPLLILGGDHTISIGTFAGFAPETPLGCIWLDAHPDMNDAETSPSGNVHGMPVAVLLGHGDAIFTGISEKSPRLTPQRTALIGIRAVDPGERALHERMSSLCWISAQELKEIGTEAAAERAAKQMAGVPTVISLDVDIVDPSEMPAVVAPVFGGPSLQTVTDLVRGLGRRVNLAALEVVELDCEHPQAEAMLPVVRQLITSCFSPD